MTDDAPWGFAATGSPVGPLEALRGLLRGADEALLCTAFVDTRGVGLLREELAALGSSARLVATTVFGGTRTLDALAEAAREGVVTRVANPSNGTFHPKVVVARHGGEDVALVGSSNMTHGLVTNIEAGVIVRGNRVAEVRDAAERWWSELATPVTPDTSAGDRFEPDLFRLLRLHVPEGSTIRTLGTGRPNAVARLDELGIWVATGRTATRGTGPQHVPPWMVTLAWEVLQARGELSNRHLLDDLRVHRSSFVCALLATLPMVDVRSTRPIVLGTAATRLAAEPPADWSS